MKLSKKMQDIVDFAFQLDVRHKYHFSDQKIDKVFSIDPSQQEVCNKPEGLWYSWGGSWPLYLLKDYLYSMGQDDQAEWARSRIEEIGYIYKVSVKYDRMLRLNTCKSFREFTQRYGRKLPEAEQKEKHCSYMDYPHHINWARVSRDYHGIDARFNNDCTYEFHWFEHWDCHSGCIWRLSTVKDLKLVWKA